MTLRRLVERFYPRPRNGFKIPLVGLDFCGKTTLLHRLKTGEIVQTIPTIGVFIETIQVPAGNGRFVNMSCWDVGGCTKFPVLFVPYTSGSDALIWVLDGCDRERLSESIEELARHIAMLTCGSNNPIPPENLPVLIIATKQDLPNPIPLGELRSKFAARTTGTSPFYLIGTSLTQSKEETEAFGWLLKTIEDIRARKTPSSPPVALIPDRSPAESLESKLDNWLARAENDSSPDKFLQQFEIFSLPAWDHYTHIRIAYLLLTIHGRQKGKDMIFDGLEKYITHSDQTRGRTFHVTMTYFWIQMVHFGISSMGLFESNSTLETSSVKTLVAAEKQTPEQENLRFVRFLLTNPHLADGNLWAEHYSKDVIMSPGAKAGMVLPDKKALPNFVAR
ncbi:ADP-ribosylation factor family-domain-containing protein [Mycena haematopus]|nr:ADP-ribosylation factor family-domain-containing protein [Mycena haematopus]